MTPQKIQSVTVGQAAKLLSLQKAMLYAAIKEGTLKAPAFKDARISGRFEAGRNDLFAEGLEGYFHFHVERPGDGQIVLTPSR